MMILHEAPLWNHIIHRRLVGEFEIYSKKICLADLELGDWFYRDNIRGTRSDLHGRLCEQLTRKNTTDNPSSRYQEKKYNKAVWKYRSHDGVIGYYEAGFADAKEKLPKNPDILRQSLATDLLDTYIAGYEDAVDDEYLRQKYSILTSIE